MIEKANGPTTYISNIDAIIDLEYTYSKISILYLGNKDSETCDIPQEVTQNFFDKVSQKDFVKKVLEKCYDHQGNGKQESNKTALETITFTGNPKKTAIIEGKSRLWWNPWTYG